MFTPMGDCHIVPTKEDPKKFAAKAAEKAAAKAEKAEKEKLEQNSHPSFPGKLGNGFYKLKIFGKGNSGKNVVTDVGGVQTELLGAASLQESALKRNSTNISILTGVTGSSDGSWTSSSDADSLTTTILNGLAAVIDGSFPTRDEDRNFLIENQIQQVVKKSPSLQQALLSLEEDLHLQEKKFTDSQLRFCIEVAIQFWRGSQTRSGPKGANKAKKELLKASVERLEVTQELIKHLQASRNEAHDRISMLERDLDDNACNELRVRNYELMLNVDQLRHHITTLNSEKRDLEDQVFHLQNEIFLKNADLKKSEKLSENRRLELLERRPGGTVIRFYQEGPDIPAEIYRLSNELRKLTEDVWKLEGMYLHEKNNSRRLEEAYRFYNGAFTQHETLIREFFQEMNTINSWQNVMEGRSEIPRQERLSETEILRCRNNFMQFIISYCLEEQMGGTNISELTGGADFLSWLDSHASEILGGSKDSLLGSCPPTYEPTTSGFNRNCTLYNDRPLPSSPTLSGQHL